MQTFFQLREKSVSKSQQKMMGMALAYKRGEMDDVSPEVKKMADSMSTKDLEDFAKTKHKGLPEEKDPCWDGYQQIGMKKKNGKEVPNCVPKESVELGEAKSDIYHKHMLKALGKKSLPKNHGYTSSIASNGDFVVQDRGKVVARIVKGQHNLKEETEHENCGTPDCCGSCDTVVNESKTQIDTLRREYSKINKIDPSGPAYKKAKALIKSMDKKELMNIAKAKIKWLSQIAATELRIAHNVKLSASEYMPEGLSHKNTFSGIRNRISEARKGSDYQIYHKDYSSAVQHALNYTFDRLGYEVDMEDYQNKVAFGPKKPSAGKTNSFSIDLLDKRTSKPVNKKLNMQIYNMDNKKYELNMYVD